MKIDFRITGSSHGEFVGAESTPFEPGFVVDFEKLASFMRRRAPGASELCSQRRETDEIEFISGVTDGKLDGKRLALKIKNRDVKRSDYESLGGAVRPGTSDLTAKLKYGKDFDNSGSGRFSGRMTAPMCALGGIILQILESKGITVKATLKSVGDTDSEAEFEETIRRAAGEGDSVGGVINCTVSGLLPGLGGPMFDGIEGLLAKYIFGIPGVKGIEFGSGFSGARTTGSRNNDSISLKEGKIVFSSNNAGGILGGISSGAPITFSVAMKPTPSIAKKQSTVDVIKNENCEIEIKGRHDPCIAIRALPVVEAVTAIAIYELLPKTRENLGELRSEIDCIDAKIAALYAKRLDISREIGLIKSKSGADVFVPAREAEVIENVRSAAGESPDGGDFDREKADSVERLYKTIFSESKSRQKTGGNYGLLGKKLGHSLSPRIYSLLGNYDYGLFETENPEEFLKNTDFSGLNVTVPYKRDVVPFLDELRGEALCLGTVNTIVRENGRLVGYNTDCFGFEMLLKTAGIEVKDKKCLILGYGGAAKAVEYVLSAKGAKRISVMKRGEKPDCEAEIIINATPVGMWPDTDKKIVDLADFSEAKICIDLIYNPSKTLFLREARARRLKAVNGLMMLCAQAVYSSRLFLGKTADKAEMLKESYRIYAELVTENNIVLVGMPGSGKTTVGKRLAKILGREFVDTDDEIEALTGRKPKDIITEDGEEAFREIETKAVLAVSKRDNAVIATGGGVVLRDENCFALSEKGIIVFLDTPLDMLATDGRPLTARDGKRKLYEERIEKYLKWADVRLVL